ncbi:MAG: hypothetical protein JJE35_15925, partial [Thermoleophilia bacterium]|nr:hypothetical protein [Thermoleophilia bacterium]
GRLRGPGAAEVGKAALARRLLAGSLDRAVDVAATLELRGYSLESAHRSRRRLSIGHSYTPGRVQEANRSRYDRRFYLAGALILAAAIAGKALGADEFHTYPRIELALGPAAIALSVLLVCSGFLPLRRKRRRPQRQATSLEAGRV